MTGYAKLYPIFTAMEECDMVLSLHGELPDESVDGIYREREFLYIIVDIVKNFPRLRIMLEHITTACAVEFIETTPMTVAATITAHHLHYTLNDVIGYTQVSGGLLRPHLYCKPVPKLYEDRRALQKAAVSGNPKFIFGSDTAPHDVRTKECAGGCAGVFSAPVLMPLLVTMFESWEALGRLEAFISEFGANFYRLTRNEGKIELVRKPWTVMDSVVTDGGDTRIMPLLAGETLPWQIVET